MKIQRSSRAGSMESNDIFITLHPGAEGIEIQLESKVMKQFGKRIEHVIRQALEEAGVTETLVVAKDSGALDYTIKSRVITAVERAQGGGRYE